MAVLSASVNTDEKIERGETDGWFVLCELIPAEKLVGPLERATT